MKPQVITSSEPAALLLRRLLGAELEGRVDVADGRSWVNAVSRARALLHGGATVALVLGPRRRRGPDAREWDKAYVYSLLNPDAARTGLPLRVILLRAPPEGLLFLEPALLLQVSGREPTPEHLAWARTAPREALSALLGVRPTALARTLALRLEGVDMTPLASQPAIQKLRKFIHTQIQRSERRPIPDMAPAG
ncbi:hypothetical protein [Pyxidicoccus xibeiensis]|uniref:hypothetical protein n=1 Tax=Pyxidicoccus xibeiensis TaxID=2906759 RepID=UPI0020A7A2A5|nr:hypothetical protein [Pyxidicoccus xibeiensis]MCP3145112.1 hypothetical protein [Pyxidicoccus xibeiensis]